MKKIIFTLLALVGTMSMNAQIVELYKGDVLVAKYKASEVDNVVFKEVPATTGTEKRTGNYDVKWVQLWKDGPKFAEYNVGATSATEHGGYYCWGGTYANGEGITWKDDHNEGTEALTGNNDTATALWGSNWRMPTKEEFDNLIANCVVEWTDSYKGSGKQGRIFTGKGAYSSNSVFLPAAGYCNKGIVYNQGSNGRFWSSTPYDSDYAYVLYVGSGSQTVEYYNRSRRHGYSVRAVLAK